MNVYIIIGIIILLLYITFYSTMPTQELFEADEITLANALLKYFKTGLTNYVGYSNILTSNNNTSSKITKVKVYYKLASLDNITLNDILAEI